MSHATCVICVTAQPPSVAIAGKLKVPVYAVAVLAVLGGLRPRGEKPNPKLMNLWNAVHSVTGYITAGR